ncbi:MAG TPA: hypothetical protein VFV91_07335 [Gaiellaceae bacterium]|nr:hypothetical protein [Gaiellaceae bacterium]
MTREPGGSENEVVKPLGIFVGVVVVGVAVIAAGLHLTDRSASAKPVVPTASVQAQFVRAGNGVCARYYQELMATFEGRSSPKTPTSKARYLRLEMPLIEQVYAGLRALVPPGREAGPYRRLLRIARREIHDDHLALHAFETGQAHRVVLLERDERRDHLSRRSNSLSRRVGLTICGLTARQVATRYG